MRVCAVDGVGVKKRGGCIVMPLINIRPHGKPAR